jgi:hypothetical protein
MINLTEVLASIYAVVVKVHSFRVVGGNGQEATLEVDMEISGELRSKAFIKIYC